MKSILNVVMLRALGNNRSAFPAHWPPIGMKEGRNLLVGNEEYNPIETALEGENRDDS
jgi:hypothetical protein